LKKFFSFTVFAIFVLFSIPLFTVSADLLTGGLPTDCENTFVEFAEANGVRIITLTNLIVNGDFSTDSNSDGLADNFILRRSINPVLLNNIQRVYGSATNTSMGLQYIITILNNNNYYFNLGLYNSNVLDSPYFVLQSNTGYTYYTISGTNHSNLSALFKNTSGSASSLHLYSVSSTTTLLTDFVEFENFIMFDLGVTPIYTKSQLDDLIAYYGYFEGSIDLVDITDNKFETIAMLFFGLDYPQITQELLQATRRRICTLDDSEQAYIDNPEFYTPYDIGNKVIEAYQNFFSDTVGFINDASEVVIDIWNWTSTALLQTIDWFTQAFKDIADFFGISTDEAPSARSR